jgi:hypothetical protein
MCRSRVAFANPHYHIDPHGLQSCNAAAIHPWIGINGTDYHTYYSSLDQRVCAGRGLSVMGARFQCYIGRRAPRCAAGLRQCNRFTMWTTALRGTTTSDNPTVTHQNTANRRVGPNLSQSTRAQPQGKAHIAIVGVAQSSI